MTVSRKWTQAINYATQAALLTIAGAYEDAHRILKAYRAYQAQWPENSTEWWLCTEAFEDEWRWHFPQWQDLATGKSVYPNGVS